MTPAFRVVADGADITALINDRLLQLKTTDKPGMESDEFELRIDDRDGAVVLPVRGANIEIFLGYAETSLARIGRYVVDDVDFSGPPDTLVITGKASDMRGSGKTTRSGSWENMPLSRIVADVAARNGWLPVCPVQTKVPRADQLNESDFNFVTRLAKQYDCTAKVADGKLLVMPRQGGQSASGKAFGVVTLQRRDVSRFQFRLGDRNTHKAVSTAAMAAWQVQDWRYGRQLEQQTRLHTETLNQLTLAAAVQQQAEQDKRLALEQRLSASEQIYYRALSDAQRDQGRLRDRLASADLRLSVLLDATDAASSRTVSATSATGSVVHGPTRAQLDPAHAQRIIGITDAGDQGLIALAACQAYAKEVSTPK